MFFLVIFLNHQQSCHLQTTRFKNSSQDSGSERPSRCRKRRKPSIRRLGGGLDAAFPAPIHQKLLLVKLSRGRRNSLLLRSSMVEGKAQALQAWEVARCGCSAESGRDLSQEARRTQKTKERKAQAVQSLGIFTWTTVELCHSAQHEDPQGPL